MNVTFFISLLSVDFSLSSSKVYNPNITPSAVSRENSPICRIEKEERPFDLRFLAAIAETDLAIDDLNFSFLPKPTNNNLLVSMPFTLYNNINCFFFPVKSPKLRIELRSTFSIKSCFDEISSLKTPKTMASSLISFILLLLKLNFIINL